VDDFFKGMSASLSGDRKAAFSVGGSDKVPPGPGVRGLVPLRGGGSSFPGLWRRFPGRPDLDVYAFFLGGALDFLSGCWIFLVCGRLQNVRGFSPGHLGYPRRITW